MDKFFYPLDHNIAQALHKLHVWGGDFMDGLMKNISYLAEAGIIFLLIGLGLILFKKTRKIGATIILAIAIGFIFTNIILKNTIARARPFNDKSKDFFLWWLDAGAVHESGYSFPSGHTTATTAFALAIFLTTNKKYSSYILLLPLLMACSRIYLMVHYFSDCIGGILIGGICATISYFILKWIYSNKLSLCVWAREFDVFHPKQKITYPSQEKPTEKPAEKTQLIKQEISATFEYRTQQDEKSIQDNSQPQEEKEEPFSTTETPEDETSMDEKE